MSSPADLVLKISECLGGLSTRSLIYAVADIYARSYLGEIDEEKILEIIAQNLAGVLGTTPSGAKKLITEACGPKPAEAAAPTLTTASVGAEKAPTLAHLVNRHVPVDAPPRAKLEVIKRLNLPTDALGEYKHKISARGEGELHVKTAVTTIRTYYPGASTVDVDLVRTALAFSRRRASGQPISDSDIYIREYAHVVDKPVYVALDVSGSMKEYMGGATKLKIAKDAIARYIKQMAELRGNVSLTLFNADADYMWTPHPAHRYLKEMLEILRYVYSMGGTEIASALELLHADAARSHVVIISDGRTNDPEKVLQLAKKFRRIHTVAAERSRLLKKIAKITGGKYRELNPTLDLLSLHT